jgi:hypothetical protein
MLLVQELAQLAQHLLQLPPLVTGVQLALVESMLYPVIQHVLSAQQEPGAKQLD